ncbi:MAG: nicotinate (nicotinamide) nucleotide adenylyltransferase [Limnobacter sp.]|nr:nicotinate (nicotinamide) nucleotide adenylyltransferase [Limnobacter sp.]
MTKQICIIGGSFDPIHMGHLQMARSAQAQCLADEVWFLPAGQPWQKKGQLVASPVERLHLTQMAIEGVRSWRVEPCETESAEPSCTANTLQALAEAHPDYQFNFVIGADQLANLTTWKYWQSLFDYARIGVVDRSDWGDFKAPAPLKRHLIHNRLFRIPMPAVNISSSEIRRLFGVLHHSNPKVVETARLKLETVLPSRVWGYLQRHEIYGRPVE